jgi:hypothetical protein
LMCCTLEEGKVKERRVRRTKPSSRALASTPSPLKKNSNDPSDYAHMEYRRPRPPHPPRATTNHPPLPGIFGLVIHKHHHWKKDPTLEAQLVCTTMICPCCAPLQGSLHYCFALSPTARIQIGPGNHGCMWICSRVASLLNHS